MNNTNVIIIGTTHHNTYSMVRCFGEYGIKPILIICGDDASYVLKSTLVKESYSLSSESKAIDFLHSHKEQFNGSVIISCTDTISSLLDRDYDSLSLSYHFFNCGKQGSVTLCMNKLLQAQKAELSGFCVPKSIEGYAHSLNDIKISYPRIIKPVESIHGGKRISICNDEESYTRELKAFDAGDKVLVQSLVEKDYEIVIVGLSIGDEVVIPGYIEKHRDTKGGTTYSSVRKISRIPEGIVNACKVLSRTINYEGLWGIELIKRGSDFFFIEMNLRNDATTYAMAVAGANLPMMYYDYHNGKTLDILPDISEITSMVEFPDFIHVLKGEVGLIKWYKQLKGCDCRYFYCENDKLPYLQSRAEFVKMLRKRILKF